MSKNVSQWFWQWGYIVIALAVVFGFWASKGGDRENQNHVNPEVFISFENIERKCSGESFEKQSKECQKVLKYQKECKQLSSNCNSLLFYQRLKSLGYQLPQYYKEGFIPK